MILQIRHMLYFFLASFSLRGSAFVLVYFGPFGFLFEPVF